MSEHPFLDDQIRKQFGQNPEELSSVDYVLQVILIFISQVDHIHVEGSIDPETVQRESASSMLKFKM